MIKKIFYSFTACILTLSYSLTHGLINQYSIDPKGKSILQDSSGGQRSIELYLKFIKDMLFNLLWLVVVGAFIYIGYLFVTARGKPEEFKKAWTHVIYVIVGIAIVSSAWGIVSLVAGIDL